MLGLTFSILLIDIVFSKLYSTDLPIVLTQSKINAEKQIMKHSDDRNSKQVGIKGNLHKKKTRKKTVFPLTSLFFLDIWPNNCFIIYY